MNGDKRGVPAESKGSRSFCEEPWPQQEETDAEPLEVK